MIVLREINYSNNFLGRITEKLDASRIEDYDVCNYIPSDCISITATPLNTKIYIPVDFEDIQYDLEDFIRSTASFIRTKSTLDRNVFILSLSGNLTDTQYIKIVRFIVENYDFCVIIDEQ